MIDMMPSRVVSIAMGVPQNGWFIGDNPTKMDDLVVPPFMDLSMTNADNDLNED